MISFSPLEGHRCLGARPSLQAVAAPEDGPATGAAAGGLATCPVRVTEYGHLGWELLPSEQLLVPRSARKVTPKKSS